jgi:exosortase/archaeosortase family protein
MARHQLSDDLRPVQPLRRRYSPVGRWSTTACLAALAVLVVVYIDTTRVWEAAGAARVLQEVFGIAAEPVPGQPGIFLPSDLPWMLSVTLDCAGALIVAPFLAIAALFALTGRFSAVRMIAGSALACAVVIVTNLFRIAIIGWALTTKGSDGYAWWHTVGGSVMSVAGVAVALLILWRVALAEPRASRTRRTGTHTRKTGVGA